MSAPLLLLLKEYNQMLSDILCGTKELPEMIESEDPSLLARHLEGRKKSIGKSQDLMKRIAPLLQEYHAGAERDFETDSLIESCKALITDIQVLDGGNIQCAQSKLTQISGEVDALKKNHQGMMAYSTVDLPKAHGTGFDIRK